MHLDNLNQINSLLLEDTDLTRIDAANFILDLAEIPGVVKDPAKAIILVHRYLLKLLENDDYLGAAALCWSREKFDPRPECTQTVFTEIEKNALIAIPGGSSLSKTYSAGVWLALDYTRDPEYTKIRLASVNASHLRTNLFAHMIDLFESSAVPLGMEISDLFIGKHQNKKDHCITGLIFPQDSTKSGGRIKGLKQGNRNKVHPKWGSQGRIRVLMDEAQNLPGNVFADLPSVMASMTNHYGIKIIISGNPEEEAKVRDFGQHCEPVDGFDSIDLDEDKIFESKTGFHVVRLDANDCENIIEDKIVFPGLQTPDGYKSIQRQGHKKYMTFCRGWFPILGGDTVVIDQAVLSQSIGECVFPYGSTNIGSADLAIKGDRVVFTSGRWGQATGITDAKGFKHIYPKPRWTLQIDQQFPIEEIHDDVELAEEIQRICENMKIDPKWLGVDSTVGGSGVYSFLSKYFGDVLGIEWGLSATEKNILAEDKKKPKELYNRQSDEMWFATSKWLQAGAIKIHPSVPHVPLFHQLSTRKIMKVISSSRRKVEQKGDWKARNQGVSPDYADSFVQLQQIIRLRGTVVPGMKEDHDSDTVISPDDYPKGIVGKANLTHTRKAKSKTPKMPWDK